MSTLSSNSTLAEIEAEYLDTVSYEEDASVSKARRFITACEMLQYLRPSQMGVGGSVSFGDQAALRARADHARQFINQQSANNSGQVRFLDFGGVRD